MNDLTTTSIIDNESTETTSSIEEFDVSFNQISKTVDVENYSSGNIEKTPTFINFIENTLKNFDLVNKNEIIEFIVSNLGLIELIEEVTPIIKNHFPNNGLALEFDKDPEISSFNKIVLYVKVDDESFEDDWEEIKKINKDIRKLSLYNDSVKNLLSLDLW